MCSKFTKIAFFSFFIFFISCSKNIDITPTIKVQTIIGIWKFQSASGSATVGNKIVDLSSDLEVGSIPNIQTLKSIKSWKFNEDLTGIADGEAFTYKIIDNTITIIQKGISFTFSYSLSDNQFIIKEDEIGIKSLIDAFTSSAFLNPITKYNRIIIYKSLSEILKTNGTPDCLVKSFTVLDQKYNPNSKSEWKFTYDDENRVMSYQVVTTNTLDNTKYDFTHSFEENKSNLGSDTKPYVIEYLNGKLLNQYYCSKNGRINRTEMFSGFNETVYPYSMDFEEYDVNENNIKTSTYSYDSKTGVKTNSYFYITEVEYINGNVSKLYSTNDKSNRHLSFENTVWSSNPVKTKWVYLYNWGNSSYKNENKNYPIQSIIYNENGSISNTAISAQIFDSKGYLLSKERIYSDGGTKLTYYNYTYICK